MVGKKKSWLKGEDSCLLKTVIKQVKTLKAWEKFNKNGILPTPFPWIAIANIVGTRDRKQCRERFVNKLNPFLNKFEWNNGEDSMLFKLVEEHGKKW